jgi:predicted site-specific integrase-resolvase
MTLLNEKELARLLGVKEQTLQVWRTKGAGPPYIKVGHTVRYNLARVEEFLQGGERRSTRIIGAIE